MKRPTLSDVAKTANVSRTAAARVLLGTGGEGVRVSAATSERIIAAAKKLHYAPNRLAQQLRGVSSRTIGVIVDSLNAPVMSLRLAALEKEASRRGYRLLIGQTHGQTDALREYVADFDGRAVEAVLALFDLTPDRDEQIERGFARFKKVVFHGRAAWRDGFCVRVDTAAAIEACVDHLVAQGKKSIALSLWNSMTDELMGLREVAFNQRIAHHQCRGVVWNAASEDVLPTIEVLDRGVDYMIRQSGADAILASNDIWATRYAIHLQRLGFRIPQDLAVIGYDNLDIATVLSPTLTTIDQCYDEYASAALDLLLDVASGQEIPSDQRVRTITPRLIVREST